MSTLKNIKSKKFQIVGLWFLVAERDGEDLIAFGVIGFLGLGFGSH
jgi:hypothetical protein